jgi:hypothetical protein
MLFCPGKGVQESNNTLVCSTKDVVAIDVRPAVTRRVLSHKPYCSLHVPVEEAPEFLY